jgi:hypothetical protein
MTTSGFVGFPWIYQHSANCRIDRYNRHLCRWRTPSLRLAYLPMVWLMSFVPENRTHDSPQPRIASPLPRIGRLPRAGARCRVRSTTMVKIRFDVSLRLARWCHLRLHQCNPSALPTFGFRGTTDFRSVATRIARTDWKLVAHSHFHGESRRPRTACAIALGLSAAAEARDSLHAP